MPFEAIVDVSLAEERAKQLVDDALEMHRRRPSASLPRRRLSARPIRKRLR